MSLLLKHGILPKFMAFFAGKYHILPVTTRAMMGLSLFLRSYWWVCILGGIALLAGIKIYFSSKASGRHIAWLMFHFRLFSKMANNIFTGMFLRTLGDMLNNDVPLSDAISIAGNTIENLYYKRYVEDIRINIEGGGKFLTGFAKNRHLNASAIQMISVGEEVGKLPLVMLKLASLYEKETDQNFKLLTSLIEPVALIFMGFVVLIIVSSIILPMFRLAGAIG